MDCPKCSVELQQRHHKGVEIDFCPACRGIWLDAGELEKIIASSQTAQKDETYSAERES